MPIALGVLILLALSTSEAAFAQTVGNNPAGAGSTQPYPFVDYGLSALSSGERITQGLLQSSTGGDMSVGSLENYIAHNLASYDVRKVLLDIGWQNYTAGTIVEEPWVDNWLNASDKMGVQNVIYDGQLSASGIGSRWVDSVLASDPAASTVSSNGTRVAFLSYDNPDVATFMENDLVRLYSYYGSHPSWVGIGTGTTPDDPYYEAGSFIPRLGYSNLSVSSYLDSSFYSSEVDQTGHLANGVQDPLYQVFENFPPSVVMSSGVWMTSSPVTVYGNNSYVEMRFVLQENVSSFYVSLYGYSVGTPSPLTIQVYADKNGTFNSGARLESVAAAPGTFNATKTWQGKIQLPAPLDAGAYWLRVSSVGSTEADHYVVYMRDYLVDKGSAYAAEHSPGLVKGGSVMQLTNSTGASLATYPFQDALVSPQPSQIFRTTVPTAFNTVILFISDRIYDPTNGTLTVTDLSAGGIVVATAVLSQAVFHGLQNWVPVTLDRPVNTVPGHVYQMTVSEPNSGYSWTTVLRGVVTSPPQAGFQGQSSYWLFQLANVDWGQGHTDFTEMVNNGVDAVSSSHMDAVQFVPSSNEDMLGFRILMASAAGGGNYSSGNFRISLWNGSSAVTGPGTVLQTVSVPAGKVPANGWLNVTGFTQHVDAGRPYWVVLSTDGNQTFPLARLTGAFAFDVLGSSDGGKTWHPPNEGPTDFAFVAVLSSQNVGNFIASQPSVTLGASGYYAQPFTSNASQQVDGVYFGPLRGGPQIVVSINPDTGRGTPSLSAVTSAVYDASKITIPYGPQFIQFTRVANLKAGERYWIVVHPIGASYRLDPLAYLPGAPGVSADSPSVVSQDGGLSWKNLVNETSFLTYRLAMPVEPLKQLSTQALSAYLAQYHSPPTTQGLLAGWTGYVASSEYSLFGTMTRFIDLRNGTDLRYYGHFDPNVSSQSPLAGYLASPTGTLADTCPSLAAAIVSGLPSADQQYFDIANQGLLATCASTPLSGLDRQIGYLLKPGADFGASSSVRVLVVGDGPSQNLTKFLSTTYNAAYLQLSNDPSLTRSGDLSSFSAVVWVSNESPWGRSGAALASYLQLGGSVLLLASGPVSGGLQIPGNRSVSSSDSTFVDALTSHTGYQLQSEPVSSGFAWWNATGLSLGIVHVGRGIYTVAQMAGGVSGQLSDSDLLVSNAIAMSAGVPQPLRYTSNSTGASQGLSLAIRGGGSPGLQVWLSNPEASTLRFTLHLNGSYFGVPNAWKELNMNNMTVKAGLGASIDIGGAIGAHSWLPLYVIQSPSATLLTYSNAVILRQLVYPNQSLFSLGGLPGQSVLSVMSTSTTPSQLILSGATQLRQVMSQGDFSNAPAGWLRYPATGTILLKYDSGGLDTVRYLALVPPPPTPLTLPAARLIGVTVVLLSVEIAALAWLIYSRARTGKDTKTEEPKVAKDEPASPPGQKGK